MYTPILPPDMDFTCKNSEGSQKSNREVICSTIFYFYFTFILLIPDFCKKKKKKKCGFSLEIDEDSLEMNKGI